MVSNVQLKQGNCNENDNNDNIYKRGSIISSVGLGAGGNQRRPKKCLFSSIESAGQVSRLTREELENHFERKRNEAKIHEANTKVQYAIERLKEIRAGIEKVHLALNTLQKQMEWGENRENKDFSVLFLSEEKARKHTELMILIGKEESLTADLEKSRRILRVEKIKGQSFQLMNKKKNASEEAEFGEKSRLLFQQRLEIETTVKGNALSFVRREIKKAENGLLINNHNNNNNDSNVSASFDENICATDTGKNNKSKLSKSYEVKRGDMIYSMKKMQCFIRNTIRDRDEKRLASETEAAMRYIRQFNNLTALKMAMKRDNIQDQESYLVNLYSQNRKIQQPQSQNHQNNKEMRLQMEEAAKRMADHVRKEREDSRRKKILDYQAAKAEYLATEEEMLRAAQDPNKSKLLPQTQHSLTKEFMSQKFPGLVLLNGSRSLDFGERCIGSISYGEIFLYNAGSTHLSAKTDCSCIPIQTNCQKGGGGVRKRGEDDINAVAEGFVCTSILNPYGAFRLCNALRSLAPEQILKLKVAFQPTQPSSYSEEFIVNGGGGRKLKVLLTGQSVEGDYSIIMPHKQIKIHGNGTGDRKHLKHLEEKVSLGACKVGIVRKTELEIKNNGKCELEFSVMALNEGGWNTGVSLKKRNRPKTVESVRLVSNTNLDEGGGGGGSFRGILEGTLPMELTVGELVTYLKERGAKFLMDVSPPEKILLKSGESQKFSLLYIPIQPRVHTGRFLIKLWNKTAHELLLEGECIGKIQSKSKMSKSYSSRI